jgi:hypothetical protein
VAFITIVVPLGSRTGDCHCCHSHGTPDARPCDLDRHRATGATGAEHDHALALERRDLRDRLDDALAVVVVSGQSAILDRDVVRRANRAHVIIDLVEQGNDRDLPRDRDGHAAVAERPERLDCEREIGLVRDVVLPELPVEPVMRVDRVEHSVDRVLRDGMAEHAGHLLLRGDHGSLRMRHAIDVPARGGRGGCGALSMQKDA